MVFQQFNLFPHLSVLQNLTLGPTKVRGLSRSEAEERAMRILERVQIPEQAHKQPSELSGGQQQRVAIARSVANAPDILLADEPTGNLDTGTELEIIDLLKRLHTERQLTLLVATHDETVARAAQRVVHLKDGQVCE